ncbi:MAG: SMP-30/gluconolactonase/LRE family protein [Acidobacteria bacterium]|nr:SMP-30/gluconolactonase/LRE family protein [Acidobacteriota bacterium]
MKFLAILLSIIAQLILLFARAQADPSNTLVVDKQGRVYFGDVLHNTVWKIEDGKLIPFIKDKHSHRVVLDEQGNLYGEHLEYVPGNDSWRFHMWKATPAGEVRYIVPPASGFPWGLLMDKEGNRYEWAGNNNKKDDSRIVKRLPDGKLVTIAGQGWGWADGQGTQAKFTSIGGITWGPDSALYVTDSDAVRRVALDGTVTTITRGNDELRPNLKARVLGGSGGQLFGLTLDAEGNFYVANYGGEKVVKIASDGKILAAFDSESGWAPSGVAVAGGDLYVLEFQSDLMASEKKGPRVRKISADGKALMLGTVGEKTNENTPLNDEAKLGISSWMKWGIALLVMLAIAVSGWRVWRLIQPMNQQIS